MPGVHRLFAALRRRRWAMRGMQGLAGAAALWVAAGGVGLVTPGHAPLISRAWAAPQDEITRRDFAIGGFKPPPRWEILPRERRSYPQLLGWASRGEGSERAVITLVGKRLPRTATLATLVEETSELREFPRAKNVRMQQQFIVGWPANQRVQLDAQLTATKTQRAQVMRQLIYMNMPFAYVLTLVCPQEQAAARFRDLDDTAANLTPLSPSEAVMIANQPAAAPPPPRPELKPDPFVQPAATLNKPVVPTAADSRVDGGAGAAR